MPVQPQPQNPDIDLLDIGNIGAEYSADLGPPSWVSTPSEAVTHSRVFGVVSAISLHPQSVPNVSELSHSESIEEPLMGTREASKAALHMKMEEYSACAAGLDRLSDRIQVVTWSRLQEAVKQSPLCMQG